jgi:hypothetical protein
MMMMMCVCDILGFGEDVLAGIGMLWESQHMHVKPQRLSRGGPG